MSDFLFVLLYIILPATVGSFLGITGTLFVKRKLEERRERREETLRKPYPEGTRFRVRTANARIEGHVLPEDTIIRRTDRHWIVENQLDGSRHQLWNVEDKHIRLAQERWILGTHHRAVAYRTEAGSDLIGTTSTIEPARTMAVSDWGTFRTSMEASHQNLPTVLLAVPKPELRKAKEEPVNPPKSRIDIICDNIDGEG